MIADFLLVQKIRNIVIYILIIRNMRKIWYRKLLRDSSEH